MKFSGGDVLRMCITAGVMYLTAAGVLTAEVEAGSQRQSGLIFSHERHIATAGIRCLACHATVAASSSGKDNLLPDKKTCSACHPVTDKKTCGTCHRALDAPQPLKPARDYSPKFSHAVHLKLVEDCEACHAGISRADSTAASHLPPMEACMACHDGKSADKQCSVCHTDPKGKLPASHRDRNWPRNHAGTVLKDDGASCRMCHVNQHCQVCHPGNDLIH